MLAHDDRKFSSRQSVFASRLMAILPLVIAVAVGLAVGAYLVTGFVDKSIAPAPQTVQFVAFNSWSDSRKVLGHGWSKPEDWGVWTLAPKADIAVLLDGQPHSDLNVSIAGTMYPPYSNIDQSVGVIANGMRVATIERNYEGSLYGATFAIPAKVANARVPMEIVFEIKNPISPKSIGDSGDARQLGFGLTSIEIEYEDK